MPGTENRTAVNAASIAMRSRLSSHLLWTRRRFADLAQIIEADFAGEPRFDTRQRAYTIGAVLTAVAFAEAVVNELFQDVADGHENCTDSAGTNARAGMSAYWRESHGKRSLLVKRRLCPGLSASEPLEPGAELFQGFALLITLNNALVHLSPEPPTAESVQRIEKQLRGKFDENPLRTGTGDPYFPDRCLSAACAKWAASVSKAMADETFERLETRHTTNV